MRVALEGLAWNPTDEQILGLARGQFTKGTRIWWLRDSHSISEYRQNGLMCGRYVMSKATSDLLSHFEAKEVEGSPPGPSWNIAPTQNVPIVAERLDEGTIDRRLLVAKWGLVPSWAKDVKIGSKLINAKSETILEKPSFRSAAVKRRAIVPAYPVQLPTVL